MDRRRFLEAGTLALATAGLRAFAPGAGAAARRRGRLGVVQITMRSDPAGSKVWFDPVGVHITPGQTVRWVVERNVHTTTAYHPDNAGHSLRIPPDAEPWDSGYLVEPGDSFQVTFRVEGTYDYLCLPHEAAGMVGRIVVGKPGGPGSLPFDYFLGEPGSEEWKAVPEAAQRAFPTVEEILRRTVVPGQPASHGEGRRRGKP